MVLFICDMWYDVAQNTSFDRRQLLFLILLTDQIRNVFALAF